MNRSVFAGYTILHALEGGGMADLYLAKKQDAPPVVLRILKPTYASHWFARRRFFRSCRILEQLSHPRIVRILDCGTLEGQPYMIMNYIQAGNMREAILHRGDMLAKNALSLLRQMADTLYYVHHAGFLHLDYKPENLLLGDDGNVTLIDFDLAIPRRKKPVKIRSLPGTPAYIAPETLIHHRVDERSDIFSFGVVCYELLSLHKPFEADTIEQERARQISPRVKPAPLNRYVEHVPAALEKVILKCLAKAPEQRYPFMNLVVKDLETII